jgi:hypothetical protein
MNFADLPINFMHKIFRSISMFEDNIKENIE